MGSQSQKGEERSGKARTLEQIVPTGKGRLHGVARCAAASAALCRARPDWSIGQVIFFITRILHL